MALIIIIAIGVLAGAATLWAHMSPPTHSPKDYMPRPALRCPHCREDGSVMVRNVKRKKGVSTAKASAAVLTGGASVLATGLAAKGIVTEARCEECGMEWTIQ